MSKASDYSKYGLARLQAELEQEREMKQMLEESVCDLRSTMCELQERLQSVDGEGNEWKTRYETQVELNGQLERQLSLIHERLEDMKGNPVDRLASIRSYEDMPLLSSTHEARRMRHFARPQRAPESKEIRGKQTDRKAEADSKKGKEGGEEEGGEACVKERGGGGGGRRAERKEEKKLQRKSRLPTLKHNLKHNP
ncbi:coiled-coil domain-containing protein 169 isoform X4 [Archocentrus centrarchus]|uniref:coiled-coil domain-containing protein 169 isoform X4 n=1 Tax=Archocentrus centrarchus TaxID=63155 RepID=UPI0011EA28D5|nr:coiled-coil domain-containing protein 169 isoform X4 [Archocentrus centrarchus]